MDEEDLTCTCDLFHENIDGTPGNCDKIDCFGGCADCGLHPSVDYSHCVECDVYNGWVDPDDATKGPDEPRVCV